MKVLLLRGGVRGRRRAGRGVDGKGIKSMIHLPNVKELIQVSGIWKVRECLATSERVRAWGRGVEKGAKSIITFPNIEELNQISGI